MMLPTAPVNHQWGPIAVDGSTLPAALSVCSGKKGIPAVMKGLPNSDSFYATVVANEDEHVADLKAATDTHIKPLFAQVMALTATGRDVNNCGVNLVAQYDRLPDTRIVSYYDQLVSDRTRRDTPPGHPTVTTTTTNATCDRLDIEAKQKP